MYIKVLSRTNFIELLKEKNINDNNVETIKDTAFISILNTTDKLYKDWYDNKEWDIIPFNENHSNVLVLEFDDVSYEKTEHLDDGVILGDYTFVPITMDQCKQLIDFIEQNLNKKYIYIHCTAGISRSGAVGLFISDFYNNKDDKKWFDMNNTQIRPNYKVFSLLKLVYNQIYADYSI